MKNKAQRSSGKAAAALERPATASPASAARQALLFTAVALVLAFIVYAPSLDGPFLFDDSSLSFNLPGFSAPLSGWLKNVRPVLYFTYWSNHQLSGLQTHSFHVVNVLIHVLTSGLIFLILRRLLTWADSEKTRRDLLAAFCAGLFLLHPVQSEAVGYIAGRSESLSVMFAMAAYSIFLYRKSTATSWTTAVTVLLFFGAAILSKEQTIALPALLILTDYWWNPGFSLRGIRDNWKLYAPMALGGLAGIAFFWRLILHAETAGFGMKDLTWYQYFFTQCRALFVYIGNFVLPLWLTVDWDFPLSRTLLDRGAIFGLAALVALCGIAWYYRRRFPLAAFGFFAYLILMAPTSSILPIKDPIADRRLYFSMLGLLLIAADALSRIRLDRKVLAAACGGLLVLAGGAAYARAAIWSDAILLWEDTAKKSPDKSRVRFHLAFAYYEQGRYPEAIAEYDRASKIEAPTYNMLIDWGLAHDALNQPDLALSRFRQAALMEATAHVHSQIAMILAKQSQWEQALAELATAEQLDPVFATTYLYRGKIYLKTNMPASAVASYERALAIDPKLTEARKELEMARQMMRTAPPK